MMGQSRGVPLLLLINRGRKKKRGEGQIAREERSNKR
jgi:hypothetical protein